MGFYGSIMCYTTQPPQDPPGALRAVIEALGVKSVELVNRWDEPDHSWRDWELQKIGVEPPEEAGFESFSEVSDLDELRELYPSGGRMLVSCGPCELGLALAKACATIPEEITNRFGPSASPILYMGWQDISDGEYEAEPFLVDRAFFSASFSNPGYPNDWEEIKRRILALPEWARLRATIEGVVGPMKSLVRWT